MHNFFLLFFSELIWPGVSKLPDFKSQFPRWEPPSIDLILPRTLSDHGKDLFKVSLTWTNTTTSNTRGPRIVQIQTVWFHYSAIYFLVLKGLDFIVYLARFLAIARFSALTLV